MTSPVPALQSFGAVMQRPAEAACTAPGRVNLIGEHTDYNDGYVLPIAIPHATTAAVARRSDGILRAVSSAEPQQPSYVSVADLQPGSVGGWASYVAGVVWAFRAAGQEITGADVYVHGDVPHGAGLSSSAALECSVGMALAEAFELSLSAQDIIDITRSAENTFVGVPNGILDQSASMLCTAGHALFMDTRTVASRQVPFDLVAAGLQLLVINTRAPHRLVDGEYAARRADCERAAALLGIPALRDIAIAELQDAARRLPTSVLRRRVEHVVSENARVLESVALLDSATDLRSLGPILTASHESLRDAYEVSCRQLDLAVDTALNCGAYGARMTGGGFGGSAIALVEHSRGAAVGSAITGAFAQAGLLAPELYSVQASAGARSLTASG